MTENECSLSCSIAHFGIYISPTTVAWNVVNTVR